MSGFNPKSDVGADGIAKRLDAQGIATTQPISRSDTGREAQSLSENFKRRCFRAEGWMARRDEVEYPSWVFD